MLASLLVLLAAGTPPAGGPLPLDHVADVPLPGKAARFDYQAVDPVNRRLYIAHLGDDSLLVFDLDAQRVASVVPLLPSVHGVGAAPERHLVFATATAEKTLAIIDDRTWRVQARVPAGEYPNGLAYDPGSNRVFVSNNRGPGVAVVDVNTARALPPIDIGGGAGNTQVDAGSGRVLAAVHGKPDLAEIDPAAARVVSWIQLRDMRGCHGLLVASDLRLAFAACHRKTAMLVAVDLRSRRQFAALPLPSGIDVLAFDPGLRRLYAASESGTVVVFGVAADGAVTELGRGFLAANAHTVAVDPQTHRVYFPIANLAGRPVLRIMQARVGPPKG